MTRWIVGDLLTGKILTDFQVSSGSWSTAINEAGSISCTVSLKDPVIRAKNLRNVATAGKTYLAVVENDIVMNAGPIWVQDYSKDNRQATLTATGMWSYFDHRALIPVLAAGQGPADVETYFENQSLATIAKRLVQQAQSATGGNVPVVLPAEIAGTETRDYLGSDLAYVGAALTDLTSVDGGPEIDFAPRFTADRQSIEWVMRVGTPAQPQLSGATTHVWDYTVSKPSIRALTVKKDATQVAATVWGVSGSSSLYSRYTSASLLTQGYPLLELVDSSLVTDYQAELDAFTRDRARLGTKPVEFWSFQVQADASPRVGEFSKGDYCLVKIADDDWITTNRDGYRRRITNLSGDQDGKWVTVTTGEVYSLNG